MPDIEFVEWDPPTNSGPVPQAPIVLDRLTPLRLLPAVLALAGAAFAIWAPFRLVYAIVQSSDTIIFSSTDPGGAHRGTATQTGIDGWGRIHSIGLGGVSGGHHPRYGVVLVACAALLVLAAGALAFAAVWQNAPHARWIAPIGRTLLVAGSAAAAAMSAALYLDYDSQRSTFGFASGPTSDAITIRLGHAWILAAIAALLALLAFAAALVARLGTKDANVPPVVSQPPQSLPVYVSQIDQVGEDL